MKNSVKSTPTKTAVTKDSKTIVSPSADAASELKDFFIDGLRDIYWAENALMGALPKMASNATSPALTVAILEHLAVTENQVARLNKVFELLNEKAEGKKC